MASEVLKKARERAHVEAFRSAWPSFPAGAIEPARWPDFTVLLDSGRRLGIEHTEFLREDGGDGGSDLKKQEALQETVTRKAWEAYERKGMPPVVVSLFWAPYDRITTARVEGLSEELAEAVATHAPERGMVKIENLGLPGSSLPDEVSFLHIARLDIVGENTWHSPRADYVPDAQAGIRRILERKERKLLRYRESCGIVWLVIVAEGLAPSSFAGVETLRSARFNSSFDEVFFFRFFDRDVLRLALERPPAN